MIEYKTLAFVFEGHSEFEDKLWEILKAHDIKCYGNHDYNSILYELVLAGASIEPVDKSNPTDGYKVKIDQGLTDSFYDKFQFLVEEKHERKVYF